MSEKMTEYPERISISPVYKQKRDDDFYLIDREAFPGRGVEYVRADLSIPRVKPLVWTHHFCGEMAATGTGTAYIIDTRDKLRLRWLKWPNGHGPDRETLTEMKAAAQADYQARVLACLEGQDDE